MLKFIWGTTTGLMLATAFVLQHEAPRPMVIVQYTATHEQMIDALALQMDGKGNIKHTFKKHGKNKPILSAAAKATLTKPPIPKRKPDLGPSREIRNMIAQL